MASLTLSTVRHEIDVAHDHNDIATIIERFELYDMPEDERRTLFSEPLSDPLLFALMMVTEPGDPELVELDFVVRSILDASGDSNWAWEWTYLGHCLEPDRQVVALRMLLSGWNGDWELLWRIGTEFSSAFQLEGRTELSKRLQDAYPIYAEAVRLAGEDP